MKLSRHRTATTPALASATALAGHETKPVVDSAEYFTYAGPVYYPSRGYCVQWYGKVGDAGASGTGVCN